MKKRIAGMFLVVITLLVSVGQALAAYLLDYAERLGLGSQKYELVDLDG